MNSRETDKETEIEGGGEGRRKGGVLSYLFTTPIHNHGHDSQLSLYISVLLGGGGGYNTCQLVYSHGTHTGVSLIRDILWLVGL